jgi:hypothetical protein
MSGLIVMCVREFKDIQILDAFRVSVLAAHRPMIPILEVDQGLERAVHVFLYFASVNAKLKCMLHQIALTL